MGQFLIDKTPIQAWAIISISAIGRISNSSFSKQWIKVNDIFTSIIDIFASFNLINEFFSFQIIAFGVQSLAYQMRPIEKEKNIRWDPWCNWWNDMFILYYIQPEKKSWLGNDIIYLIKWANFLLIKLPYRHEL